ncbi:MAG: polysaccharide pyruvyl transferase family protein [Gemmataceae bacterium]
MAMAMLPGSSAPLLLRSSWQTVNIGDVAHTPGMLALLEKHFPQQEVWLWPSKVDNGVDLMLQARFPKLRILQGEKDQKEALEKCAFLLHGSGPSIVGMKTINLWRKETGKPYGILGVTLPNIEPDAVIAMNGAKFLYCRDSVSLQLAKSKGVKCTVMDFAPDGAFATDLADEAKAAAFLKANHLEEGNFVCCIPRLRYTPYWKIHGKKMTAEDDRKHAVSESKKEQDHKPLRDAIVRIVKETDIKVLLCPEDASQMEVGREMLYEPLEDSIRKRVVLRREFWKPDEALSVYRKSVGLFGNEMHSPIMCIGNGIPAIVCRWSEQTSKGYMWRDIGLNDWLFDMDQEADRKKVADTVVEMVKNRKKSLEVTAIARKRVIAAQDHAMQVLAKAMSAQ